MVLLSDVAIFVLKAQKWLPPAPRLRRTSKTLGEYTSQINTSARRQAVTSQVSKASGFTSEMERRRNETTSQARLREFSEDMKKIFGFK